MVKKYPGPGALEITMKVLENISRNDLVLRLKNLSLGPKGKLGGRLKNKSGKHCHTHLINYDTSYEHSVNRNVLTKNVKTNSSFIMEHHHMVMTIGLRSSLDPSVQHTVYCR